MPECERHREVAGARHVRARNRRAPQHIVWMLGALVVLLPLLAPELGAAAVPRAYGATPVAATEMETVSVYLIRHDWFGSDVVAAARRDVAIAPGADDLARAEAALAALMSGPTDAERAAGLTTTIPEVAQIRVLAIEDGVASVDVPATLTAEATAAELPLRLAQIVFTLTGTSGIDRVLVQSDGGSLPATPRAVNLSQAVDRGDFVAQTPPILVESPTVGASVTNPLQVQGMANTYEGGFYLRVEATGAGQDEPVTLVAPTEVQTSGSGTPGAFDVSLDLPDDASGQVTLVVYQVAPDAAGTEIDVNEIPIVLTP